MAGELVGHKDLVSGFSFCQHAGQSHICVSSSSDGTVRFWDSDSKVLLREHAAHQVRVRCRPQAAAHLQTAARSESFPWNAFDTWYQQEVRSLSPPYPPLLSHTDLGGGGALVSSGQKPGGVGGREGRRGVSLAQHGGHGQLLPRAPDHRLPHLLPSHLELRGRGVRRPQKLLTKSTNHDLNQRGVGRFHRSGVRLFRSAWKVLEIIFTFEPLFIF